MMNGDSVEQADHPTNMLVQFQQEQQPIHESKIPSPAGATNGEEPTVDVVRRRRGRPPGSKNKPKQPIFLDRGPMQSMSPHILQLASGVDVVEAVWGFCRNRNMGLCVLAASGSVANVALRQSSSPRGGAVIFNGRFDILSLSATILPPTTATVALPDGFAISLAGPEGRILGGHVVGPLLTAGTVYVVASSFNNPSFHRLPTEDQDVRDPVSGGNNRSHSPPRVSGGGDSAHPPAAVESRAYNCYLPSNLMWPPGARQPPPPPY